MKKEWIRPQLIVIVRGSAEEYVLNGCKSISAFNGPSIMERTCRKAFSVEGSCASGCYDYTES